MSGLQDHSNEDRFSFGLWTVGWTARDPFGEATRAPLDPLVAVEKLASAGCVRGSPSTTTTWCRSAAPPQREMPSSTGSESSSPITGMIVPDDHHEPVHPPGLQGRRLHQQRPGRAAVRTAQGAAQPRARRRARRPHLRDVGRTRRQRIRPGQRRPGRSRPLRARQSTCSPSTSSTRATTSGSRSSPSRTSPAATSCYRPSVTRIAFIDALAHPELVGVNPEVGHEQMAGMNFASGIAQALWQGKLFHIDLNGQRGIKYDQDLVFGHGDLHQRVQPGRPPRVRGCPGRRPRTTGPATSTSSHRAPKTMTASGRQPRPTCVCTCC